MRNHNKKDASLLLFICVSQRLDDLLNAGHLSSQIVVRNRNIPNNKFLKENVIDDHEITHMSHNIFNLNLTPKIL